MSLFKNAVSVEEMNRMSSPVLMGLLGIKITRYLDDGLEGTMPVDSRTHQPLGLLHGGASAALIESLASMATYALLDAKTQYAVGLEINANHIRAVKSGLVTGRVKAIHIGRSTHIWSVDITDEAGKLVCTGRMTMLIHPAKPQDSSVGR